MLLGWWGCCGHPQATSHLAVHITLWPAALEQTGPLGPLPVQTCFLAYSNDFLLVRNGNRHPAIATSTSWDTARAGSTAWKRVPGPHWCLPHVTLFLHSSTDALHVPDKRTALMEPPGSAKAPGCESSRELKLQRHPCLCLSWWPSSQLALRGDSASALFSGLVSGSLQPGLWSPPLPSLATHHTHVLLQSVAYVDIF